MSWKKTAQSIVLSLLLLLALPAAVSACATGQQSCTSNYAVGEAFFGSGGNLSSCGSTYCTKQSAGETAVGNTKSTNYQAQAGFNTDRVPSLQFIVNSTNIDLGVLAAGVTSTATATFSVKTYLASGYVVQTVSAGPSNGNHVLSPMATTAASNASTEQFGMNLVANNSCAGIANGGGTISGSASPVQVPSNAYSFGTAATGYNTACQFKYVNGDTVASSSQSSGETDYTVSYIFNITNTTPAGVYTMSHVLVATSTF